MKNKCNIPVIKYCNIISKSYDPNCIDIYFKFKNNTVSHFDASRHINYTFYGIRLIKKYETK